MKKAVLIPFLVLLFQLIVTNSFAVPVPLVAAGGVVVLFPEVLGLDSSKSESAVPKKGLSEFAALNNTAEFSSLLKQTAGGSSNTLDILK